MSPLHYFGDFVRELFLKVPLELARGLFVLLMLALLIWVLTLPKKEVSRSESSEPISENLRIWAALALLVQVVVYVFL